MTTFLALAFAVLFIGVFVGAALYSLYALCDRR